jgi:type I restriction enzyme S subunit
MENNLPKGWETPLLGDVVTIKSGNSKLTKKKYIPNGKYTAFSGTGPDGKTDFYEHEGDAIILSAVGARCGKCFRATGKWTAIANTSIIRLKIDNPDVYRYLFYMFNNENFWPKGGTGQPFVKSGVALKEMRIPFPPIPQQKLIADKLDILLAKVKDAQSRLNTIPQILGRFRQSIFAAAFSGELTKEWRDKNKIDAEWQEIKLGVVLSNLKYGTAKKCSREKKKHPVLRIPNVVQGYIDLNDLKYTDLDKKEHESLKLETGDILLIRSNGSVSLVGRTAVVTEKEKGMAYAGYLIRLRVKQDLIIPEFLQYQFQSYAMRLQIELPARSTSGVNNINSEEVRNLQIALPSLDEQKEVVRRLKSSFAFLEKNEQEFVKAKSYADKLESSILAKAFRGELAMRNSNNDSKNERDGK